VGALEKEILRAAKRGDLQAVRGLVAQDPSLLGARDTDGSTPLHCAAWKGHAEVAEALLDAGAEIDAESQNTHYGTTALHAAAHGNQRRVVEVLLARGADDSIRNKHGRTPLEETAIHNATAAAKLLREHAQ